jgi:hypothetical protein
MLGHREGCAEEGMTDLGALFTPGMIVRNPDKPEWGEGQVQSNVAGRITVNFRETRKVALDGAKVTLIIVRL